MAQIIAVVNKKGGVGKTTTVVNLARLALWSWAATRRPTPPRTLGHDDAHKAQQQPLPYALIGRTVLREPSALNAA